MGEVSATENPATDDEQILEEGGGDEDSSVDNETPAIEEETTPEETPEVTPEEPASSDLGMEIMAVGDITNHAIEVKVIKGEDDVTASKAATVKWENNSVTVAEDEVTVIDETPIEFTIEFADEIELATGADAVTAKVGDDAKPVTKDEDTGIYTIANDDGSNKIGAGVEITIKVVDVEYTLAAPTTGSDKNITWQIKEKEAEDSAYASTVKVKRSDSVIVQATLAANQPPVEVTLNGTKKLLTATADAAATEEFEFAAADLIDEDGEPKAFETDYVVRKEVTYIVTADEGATVSIVDAAGETVAPEESDADGATSVTYKLTSNETYLIKIAEVTKAEDLTKIQSVKVGGTAQRYNSAKNGFEFTTGETDNVAITVECPKAATAFDVTFVMDEEKEVAASVKANEYKNGAADDAKFDGDETAQPIGASKKYENVWKGTDFSFTLELAEADKAFYEVTKVETSTDNGENWTVLEAEDGTYTITEISADTKVKVSTDFQEGKAYSITFTADGDVKSVTADLAGSTDYAAMELGKEYRIKAATGAAVTFQITTETGYTVDKVTYDSEKPALTDNSGVYTYDQFDDDNKTVTINISTKANALTEDKYVAFSFLPETGVTLDVKGVKPEKNDNGEDVYKLTKKDDEAVDEEGNKTPVAEISELAFDVIVPYGSYLPYQLFADGTTVRATTDKRVKSEDGKTWTYSYKVVANLIEEETTSLEEPYVIDIKGADAEHVTLKLAAGSDQVDYRVLGDPYTSGLVASGNGTPVDVNETVILHVENGLSLKVNGEAVELDDSNKYRLDTELDEEVEEENGTVYEIEAKSAAAYKLLYTVGTGAQKTAGDEAVDVEYGDEVTLNLVEADGTAKVISDKELSADSSEFTLADQTATPGKATVIVKDAEVTVTLYAIEEGTVNGIPTDTKVEAAKITFNCKDASGKTLTVKGITKGKSVKLDATSVTSYALTLKEGRTTLNAADYDKALKVAYGDGDETKVKATIEGGNLIVKPLAAAEAEVKILAAADDTELFNFTVNGQTPALKVKSVTSVNQGMHDILVDVAADASIKTISDQFDLYYEVEVKKTDGASTLNKEGFYYLDAENYDAKGKFAPVSQLFRVNNEVDNEKMENTYTFTVRLVAVAAGTDVTVGDPANSNTIGTKLADADVKFATATANIKVGTFKTRKGYYEDKLGVTKKTTKLYSGQQDILVAIPKFSKNASHIEDIKPVVYNKDGSLVSTSLVDAYVDPETLGVYVDTYDYSAGTYDVVIYATATKDDSAYDMYRASAKVPITVQKSIDYVDVDYPTQVAVLGRDASITLKTTGWYYINDDTYTKAQTQKFLYELDEVKNPKNKDKVIVKNNKITVKKDFSVGADPLDNTFTVNVIANDYGTKEENLEIGRYMPVEITVTNEALEISSVKLVDYYSGKELPDTITTEELEDACVSLTDGKGKEITDFDLVTLTPNKGKIYASSTGYIYVNGYQKNLTIKAVTKDGGKKSASSKKYTITYPEGISYDIKDWDYTEGEFATLSKLSSGAVLNKTGSTYTYLGRGNDTISFYVTATTGSGVEAYERQADTSLFNYSVKVTGGKVTSSKNSQAYGYYAITPNKDTVEITITDKTKKAPNNTTKFTFKDNGWTTTAAPSASTKGKLYAAKNETNGSWIGQDLTYTVKWKNNVSYEAVKLNWVSGISINGAGGIKSIADDTFTLDSVYSSSVGTAKYSVVYGDYDEDKIFIPKTKAATLSIKVSKAANPKAVAKYTINPKVSMSVPLEVKPALAGYESRVTFKGVLSANNKGNKNQFYDYFEVVGDKLQIKADRWTQLDKLDPKTDLTGYLVYEYYDATTGRKVEKQDKITVVISDKTAPKYTATNVDIVAVDKATAATTIKLGNTPVAIAKVALADKDKANWDAALPTTPSTDGIVNLTAKAAPVAGNVELYVIPTASQKGTGDALTAADPLTDGVKVTVKVTTKAADDNKTKITLAKGVKTPVASINKADTQAKVDLTVELKADRDFTYNLSNAKIKTAEKTKATLTGDNKTAADAVTSVTLNEAEDTITIVLNRDGLAGNKQYKVPVDLTFTAGADETVYFPIKTEKVPTKDEVRKDVEKALDGFVVSKASYNNAAAAAKEVETATKEIAIPAVSGIEVTAVAADNAETFADKGETKGDHKIKITLTELTQSTDNTVDAVITVTEEVTVPTVGDALKEAIEKFVIPEEGVTVAGDKIPVTKALESDDTIQTELQRAVDTVAKNKYIVKVSDIRVEVASVDAGSDKNEGSEGGDDVGATAADEAAEKVTNLTFNYQVLKATTLTPMQSGKDSYNVDVKEGTIDTPPTTPDVPVTPDPDPEDKEVATIEINTSDSTDVTTGAVATIKFTATLKASDGTTIEDAEKIAAIGWKVERTEGTKDANTKIEPTSGNNAEATLTVAADETAGELTVTAEVGDKTDTATVTVKAAESGDL